MKNTDERNQLFLVVLGNFFGGNLVKAFRRLARAEGNEIVEAGWALQLLWKLNCSLSFSLCLCLCITSITIGAKQPAAAAPISPFSQKVERGAPH